MEPIKTTAGGFDLQSHGGASFPQNVPDAPPDFEPRPQPTETK